MAGQELIIDAEVTLHMSDRKFIRNWLCETVEQSGMTVLGEQSHLLPTKLDSGPGVTAIVVLAESHAAIHTWTEERVVTLNFYSCKMFNTKVVFDSLCREFGVTKVLLNLVVPRYGIPVKGE